MDNTQLANLEDGALRLLQRKSKATDLQIFLREVDTHPATGNPIFFFGAVSPANPDKTHVQVVVDESGAEIDPKSLADRKAIFGGDFWPWRLFSYSVKYVYGTQPAGDGCCCLPGVRSGTYATDINIHNFQEYTWAAVTKSVVPLILAGTPQGREPRAVTRAASDRIILRPGFATMDDGCRINELLFNTAPPTGQPLNVGYLEIMSSVELKVTAVYTATDLESRSVSIDVDEVTSRFKYPYYFPFPRPVPVPVAVASTT